MEKAKPSKLPCSNPTANYSPCVYKIKFSMFEYYSFKRVYIDFTVADAINDHLGIW